MLFAMVNSSFFNSAAFGIIAMVIVGASWCLIGFIMGQAPKKGIEPSLVQLLGSSVSCIVGTGIMVATNGFPQCEWKITALTCGTYFVGSVMNFFMLQIMAEAMQRGPNGIIWSIIQSALVFPFIGGIVFFGVQLTPLRFLGISSLICALVLFGLGKNNTVAANSKGGWRLLAFTALAICAVQQNLTTAPSYFPEAREVSSIARSVAASLGTWITAVIYNYCRLTHAKKAQIIANFRMPILWKYVSGLQFFGLIFAYTLFYPGMNVMADHGLGGMCYPMMVGSCIVSFTLVSVSILKEKLQTIQAVALAVCILGLYLICQPVT